MEEIHFQDSAALPRFKASLEADLDKPQVLADRQDGVVVEAALMAVLDHHKWEDLRFKAVPEAVQEAD
jgi:inorganic pyrophosphatase/exopolyphosphatase